MIYNKINNYFRYLKNRFCVISKSERNRMKKLAGLPISNKKNIFDKIKDAIKNYKKKKNDIDELNLFYKSKILKSNGFHNRLYNTNKKFNYDPSQDNISDLLEKRRNEIKSLIN